MSIPFDNILGAVPLGSSNWRILLPAASIELELAATLPLVQSQITAGFPVELALAATLPSPVVDIQVQEQAKTATLAITLPSLSTAIGVMVGSESDLWVVAIGTIDTPKEVHTIAREESISELQPEPLSVPVPECLEARWKLVNCLASHYIIYTNTDLRSYRDRVIKMDFDEGAGCWQVQDAFVTVDEVEDVSVIDGYQNCTECALDDGGETPWPPEPPAPDPVADYKLTNCDTAEVIYSNSNLATVVGKVVKSGEDCWSVASWGASAPEIEAFSYSSVYDDCETCLMKLFELNDCAGVAATIFTDTDLTAHVGEVIQIGITCYTVAEYAGTLPEDIESVSGAFYETCEACDIPVYKLTPCVSGSAIYTEDDFSEYVGRTVYIGTTCYQVTEEGGLPITSPASPSSDHDSCENCAVYYRLKKCFNDADTDYYILASQIGDDEGLKIGDYCYYFDTENPLHKDEITGTPSYVTMASGDALSSCTNSICRYRQARRCSDEELSGYFMAVDDQIPFKYEGVCFYFDNADTPAQRESAEILGTILTPGMVEEVDDCEDSACVAGCVGDDSEWDYVIDGYEFGDVSTASCGGCAVNPDTGEWLGTWHGDPNGCVWKPTGGRLDNGHLVSSGNSTISFVTDRWVMIIQCSAGTIAWQGDKLTGTSPAGTYSRTGGCSATPSSLTIVAA